MTTKQHPQANAVEQASEIFRRAVYPKRLTFGRVFIEGNQHIKVMLKEKRVSKRDRVALTDLGWQYDALGEYWLLGVKGDD